MISHAQAFPYMSRVVHHHTWISNAKSKQQDVRGEHIRNVERCPNLLERESCLSNRRLLRLTINTNVLKRNTNHDCCFQLHWNVCLYITYSKKLLYKKKEIRNKLPSYDYIKWYFPSQLSYSYMHNLLYCFSGTNMCLPLSLTFSTS